MVKHCSPPRLLVIGLDGLPFTLTERLIADGHTPTLARIVSQGRMQQMDSVIPTVSSVAWTSFLTGVQPGKHGLYGFIRRRPGSYDIDVCASDWNGRETVPEIVSRSAGTAFSMNVPVTTPPRRVNGVMIGCFLSNDLDHVAWPPEESRYLKSIDYRIDIDVNLARRSKRDMLGDIRRTVQCRFDAALHYLAQRPWDWFHVHVMATDRLNHFLLAQGLDGDGELGREFFDCYRFIDSQLARLIESVDECTPLVVLSDHGFARIKQEVQLSRWMVDHGWTVLRDDDRVGHPLDFDPERTRAYTIIPGQIFLNLKGREPAGVVLPEDYEAVRDELAQDLMDLHDHEIGDPVIRQVLRREELFWPAGRSGPDSRVPLAQLIDGDPVFGRAPDLVALEHVGYDLKMGLGKPGQFERSELEGMHTTHDATLISRGFDLPPGRPHIVGLTAILLKQLGLSLPEDIDANVWNKERP